MKSNEPISSLACSAVNFGNRVFTRDRILFGYSPVVNGSINLKSMSFWFSFHLTSHGSLLLKQKPVFSLWKPYSHTIQYMLELLSFWNNIYKCAFCRGTKRDFLPSIHELNWSFSSFLIRFGIWEWYHPISY